MAYAGEHGSHGDNVGSLRRTYGDLLKAKRISGSEMSAFVTRREPFVNSKGSVYAIWHTYKHGRSYVVYSYGSHFPMYAYVESCDQWFGNSDKYSITTTRHHGHAHPRVDDMHMLTTEGMKSLGGLGIADIVRIKVLKSIHVRDPFSLLAA